MAQVRNVIQHWYLCPVGEWVSGPYQMAQEGITCPNHGRETSHHITWADPADNWPSGRVPR